MRRLLLLPLLLLACLAQAQQLFVGAGVNTHGQLLPVAMLRAIRINWVRVDLPVQEVTKERVWRILKWYKGMPVLWMLSQLTPRPSSAIRQLASWGVADIEAGNEPELGKYNPGGLAWQGAQYGRWFLGLQSAARGRVRLWGPACSYWNPAYIQNALAAGMRPYGVSFHGYGSTGLAGAFDIASKEWRLPVIVSEVGPGDEDGPAAIWYMDHLRAMGDRPWCYYDGPDTNGRGLFGWNGRDWSTPTAVYSQILIASSKR